jgi:isopentenyl diphosphate isomerase/L-lactate dehydrogenase-like FMN-dependent dehydrogenase
MRCREPGVAIALAARSTFDRAKSAGCSALVLTLNLQIMGQRNKDIKNGLSVPPKISLRNQRNMMMMVLRPNVSIFASPL